MLNTYKVTIAPFIVSSTSKERIEQEIRDFFENELYLEVPPDDSKTEITIEQQ